MPKQIKHHPKPERAAKAVRDLDLPELFFNRELSWLEFNQRVLEEAQDAANPVLERLKFLAIVSSNLDEFFEIRVAGLQQQAETHPGRTEPDGMTPLQTLDAIAARVVRLTEDQYRCYREHIVPGLAQHGIDLHTVADLNAKGRAWAANYFAREVFPVLTPLAIDPAHPFPQLLNKSLNLAVALSIPDTPGAFDGLRSDDSHEDTRFGVVQVPRVLPRLVALPPDIAPPGRRVYVFLSSIISEHIGQLFPGLAVEGCYAFRVTRNSELYFDEDEADNLLEAMRDLVQKRRRGDAVRLEVQRGCDPAVVGMLLSTFELEPIDLYEVDGPINLPRLMTVYSGEKRPDLKDAPFTTAKPRALRHVETPDEMFAALRHGDILMHHPYDSFSTVTNFVETAARDPHVLAIKQTLYRTSGDSPIVRALMRASENGKQVTALVELKARFDEENNIQWARRMEEAGVHVLYGLVGLKTHCKMCLVVRREDDHIRRYIHLSTGNYNPVTARLYTDIGFLTARPDIGEDAAKIFNLLTGMSQFPGLAKLRMAPFGLHDEFIAKIDREAENAGKQAAGGRQQAARKTHHPAPSTQHSQARIVAKMNSLVDPEIIQALYRASQAGVQIDLVVRGVCCLRPGVPGVSENIRVRSVVDRFLEHSRIYFFANGGEEEIWCGSADWMPRNFFRRIEVMFPVEDPKLKARLRDEVLQSALGDNVKARLIRADGGHERVRPRAGEAPLRSQAWLLARAIAGEAEHDTHGLLDERPMAPPVAPAESASSGPAANGVSAAMPHVLPGLFEMVPRSAPQHIVPLSTDGRAGTANDPVLQSAAAELATAERLDREAPPGQRLSSEHQGEHQTDERATTTVVSDEPVEPISIEQVAPPATQPGHDAKARAARTSKAKSAKTSGSKNSGGNASRSVNSKAKRR